MLPYLRLLRLPNVFTALADIAMGYAVARRQLDSVGLLAMLLASSACLYLAGMVLNDVFDVEVDRKERPQRPIPSGAVSLTIARRMGFTLLGMGMIFGWGAGFLFHDFVGSMFRPGVTATVLAAAILAYNGWSKQTWLGSVNMGLCRFLNVLLGASAGGFALDYAWLGWSQMAILAAAGVGIYIVGVTIFARQEAEEESGTARLIAGTGVMIAGLVVLGGSCLATDEPLRNRPEFLWLMLALLSVTVLRHCLTAMFDASGRNVQQAVKRGILSLIMFDAAVCLMVIPNWYALGVILLMAPAFLLGRWIYST